MRCKLGLLALLLSFAAACKSKDDTEIVVAVWSDLAVPTEIDTVRVDVTGPTDNSSNSFALTAGGEADETKLPVRLELVPLAAKNATFTVKATGLLGRTEIVSQSARVVFVPGQALLLKLFLGRACEAVTCPADTTCASGACNQAIVVDNLPPYDPSKPLLAPDAGAAINGGGAGLDSGSLIDAGMSEAGAPDLGAIDIGPIDVIDAPLDTSGSGVGVCTFGTSTFGSCTFGP